MTALPAIDPVKTGSRPARHAEPDPAAKAVELAERLLRSALMQRLPQEKQQAERMAGLISDPAAKRLSMAMTDRLVRSRDPVRAASGWRRLLRAFGLPRGFGWAQQGLLAAGAAASWVLPGTVIEAVRRRMRDESKGVILPAEDAPLSRYLADRAHGGWRVNLNQLGEAVLGEEEAKHRLNSVLALLARDDVSYVSVKISAIFSQINLQAWDDTLSEIKDRLRQMYRAAMPKGKFVNLDMEEYRDLALTVAAFREVLSEPEFRRLSAGIVLQAYLPDSWAVLQGLTEWARQRMADGGVPMKVRIVKGANLAMEQVEAEMHGWSAAPYPSKPETDANFKRMLDFACQPENTAAVRIGVASHNLFDVALALVLREMRGVGTAVEIEMLEGMANHQARAVREAAGSLLVYAPVVHEENFGSALAYLIRRLDENTADENFLRHLFELEPGSAAWEEQKQRFLIAWQQRDRVSGDSRREVLPVHVARGFYNTPDTDWTQAKHRERLEQAAVPQPWKTMSEQAPLEVMLATAVEAQSAWAAMGNSGRAAILRRCAEVMESHRFETIVLLREEGKKAIPDADTEVSEAVDFARYYASTGSASSRAKAAPLGTVVVTPPWNFPFAIPCGGVLAALMAGNTVILKPAPEVMAIGAWLVQQLWEGGVPHEVLQFARIDDGEEGRALISDPRVSAVVLTGAYETARLFQSWRPSLRLFAETSGKNSIIVSALADRDLAIKDIVRSAFGHAGQKCSAASLAILEAEVHDDPAFLRQLHDAAASLAVGPASDPRSVVTPLIRPAGESLQRALTTLDEGESWLLEPRQDPDDPCLWSPGIKLGVKAGSWFHQTECFGPVLGLMRAKDLDEAARMQNAVSFGLTAGFHSLDEAEIAVWREKVEAGNLYINRAITGAIVQRQPFGGWKRSSIGPGAKAGGPNYVNLFRRQEVEDAEAMTGATASYHAAWRDHFSKAHDPSALRAESNEFCYRPCRGVILRLDAADPVAEELARTAASLCGAPLVISRATEESASDFAARLPALAQHAEFLRTLSLHPPEDEILRAAHAADLNWIDAPMSAAGRVELTRWLREQTVSETRHRYGNLMPRLS